jgi:hypothetical protein
MDQQASPSFSGQIIMLLIFTIPIAITAHILAKEKGRNVVTWTILGSIPILNFLLMSFFVGASNLRLERKIDDLIKKAEKTSEPH